MTTVLQLIENNEQLKMFVVTEKGEIKLASKGARLYFSIKDDYTGENFSTYFPHLKLSHIGESYHAVEHNGMLEYYRVNIGESINGELLVSFNNMAVASEIEKQLAIASDEKELLTELVNQTSIVSITDEKGIIKKVNDKFLEISEYSEEELIGQNQSIVSSGSHSPDFWKSMWKVIGKGGIWKDEIKNKSKSGKIYWVETVIMPRMKNGRPTEYISIRTDITKRKELEKEVEQKAMFYQEAAQLSKLGCWEIDLEKQVPIWDDVVKQIHEVPMDFVPDMETAINFYSPEVRPHVEKAVSEALANGTSWEFELPLVTAKGNKIWVKAIGRVEKERDEIKKIFGVFQDISDKIEFQESKLAKQLAEKKAAFKESFLANMSHEIRTPMNGVIGIVDLLMATELDDYQKELLEIVHNSSDKLLKILNDILDLSKIQAGKFELQNKPLSIVELLKQVRAIFNSITTQKGLGFKLMLDEDIPDFVMGDETRLFQVLSNIISNAVKFTDEGQVSISCFEKSKGVYEFKISDTGVGIPQDKLTTIFQEFSQMENSYTNNIKGTGLGLPISKKLIHLMGGGINVSSTPGKGTTFTLTIPLKASKKKKEGVSSTSDEIEFRGKVLVVEDNKTNQKVIALMLKKLGIEFDQVYDGEEALEKFDESIHQLVFMDINMPKMGGEECTSQLRAKGVTNKIYALTGNAMEKDIQNYKEKGFDFYLTKPLELKTLTKVFQDLTH